MLEYKNFIRSKDRIKYKIYEKYEGRCGYCNKEIDIVNSEIDLFQPCKEGGTADENNCVLSCKECNRIKGGFSPIDKDGKELILNPINDKFNRHIKLNSAGIFEPLTDKGKNTIDILKLNRESAIKDRLNNRNSIERIYIDKSEVNNYSNYTDGHYCCVSTCSKVAQYAVFLCDCYTDGEIFIEQDITYKYICEEHHIENEKSYTGVREPGVISSYKYTNKNSAQGYTRYLNIQQDYNLKIISEKSEKDYLGINKDVESFANLIMNKDLELPMNIGIFGGWGTGKSFFINALKRELDLNYDNNESVIVEFNAWNYYDSNITVNLVYNIFGEINKKISEESNNYLKGLKHFKQLKDNDLLNKRKEIEENINRLSDQKENINEEFIINIAKQLEVYNPEIDEILKKYNNVQSNLNKIAKDIQYIPSGLRFVKELLKSEITIITIIFIILFFIAKNIPNNLRIFSIVSSLSTLLINVVFKGHEFIKKFKSRDLYIKIKDEIIKSSNKLKSIDRKIEDLKEKDKSLIYKSEQENISVEFLKAFISEKLNSQFYKESLSFTSIVKQDIDNLDMICKDEEGLKKFNKIVLIIDDLDRCPQDKVVEVLQTIQLLLSTNMFIVIIAVDSKWINNCIISEYDKLLTHNEHYINKNLFAINYLEKIIHIPFWMDSLSDNDSLNFIETIFGNNNLKRDVRNEVAYNREDTKLNTNYTNSDKLSIDIEKEDINSTKKNITLSDNDLMIIKEMNFIFNNISPRKIKRFLNTALIIKYKYFDDSIMYKQILFGAATIILKPSITNALYKYIFKEYINDTNKTVVECIDSYLEHISDKNNSKKFINQIKNYIQKNWSDLKLIEFEKVIYKSSRYTYYHGEIFN